MKAMTNTIINSMMSNVVKYICAVVLLLGINVDAWGATITLHYGASGASTTTHTVGVALPSIDDLSGWSSAGVWMKEHYSSSTYPSYGTYYSSGATNFTAGDGDLYALYQNSSTSVYSTMPGATSRTISFSVGYGTAPSSRTGTSITLPSIPALCSDAVDEGWLPYGWATASVAVNSSSATIVGAPGETYIPDADRTLYAVYVKPGTTLTTSTTFSLVSSGRATSAMPTSGYIIMTEVNQPRSAISNTISSTYISEVGNGDNKPTINSSSGIETANACIVWEVASPSSGVFTFRNLANGKYLGLANSATAPAAGVLLDNASTDYAKWTIPEASETGFYLKNKGQNTYYLRWTDGSGWRGYDSKNGTTDNIYIRRYTSALAVPDSKYQSSLPACYLKVFYEANGGSGTMTDNNNYNFSDVVTVLDNTFTAPTGYSFAYWTADYHLETAGDDIEIGGRVNAGTEFFMPAANVTFTAQWTPTGTFITLDKGTGGSADGEAMVFYDATELDDIEHATNETEGYHLVGYFTNDATPVQVLTSEGEFAAPNITGYVTNGKWSNTNDEITLYAHWELNTHSIHWYKNDESADDLTGSYTDGDDVAYGTTITAPNTPTFTGHTFTGWSETSSGSTVTPVTSMPDADKTYYAIWSLNSHTLTISSVDNVTISSSTPSVAEGSNAAVNYGTTVTLNKTGITSGNYWGGWKVYKTGDTNTPVAVSNNQFTMPDYDVTVSAIIYPKAKLLTRCQNTVTYHYAGGTTSERVATDAHPTGYTPADCENKRFMGWSETDITVVQQVAPSMTDPTTVAVDGDLDYYAVYASPNGGKVTGSETLTYTENFESASPRDSYTGAHHWATNDVSWESMNMKIAVSSAKFPNGGHGAIYYYNSERKIANIVSLNKFHDINKITFEACRANSATLTVLCSKDGSRWTTLATYSDLPTTSITLQTIDFEGVGKPGLDDYYVKFNIASNAEGAYIYLDNIKVYSKSRSVWYSDYSNGCDVAGTATLTYKDIDGTTTVGTHAAAPSVPEAYPVEEQTKTGYTFDYITVYGQTYAAGDKYLLAHDVDAVITWKENPTISGDVYVTAGYTNSTAQPVQSSMTVTATTTENKTGTLTIDNATGNEGGTFEAIITNGTVNNASLNATIAIKYTPTQAGVEETATMTATIDGASTNFTVHGRSLPAEFVIAAKQGNNWYALPADMSEAQNPSGKTIQVDNVSDPTVALIAQPLCRYQLYAGNNAGNIDVTKVRFNPIVTETNRNALWGSESNSAYTIRNWAAIGSGNDAHYQWSMSTTDNETYVLHLNAANGGAGRDLEISQSGSNIGKWGLYGTSSSAVIRFLPVTEEYAEAEFSVVEWYPTKVMIETNQTPTDIQSSINGGEFTAKVSPVGDGNKYVINTGTLTACYAQPLTIKYVTDAETVAKTMDIPIIISGNASASVEALVSGMSDGAYYKYTDLVVRDNSVLTIDGSNQAKNTFRNVWIMPSGKIIVPDTKRLTASSLNLFGGIDDIYNGSTYTTEKYGVPEFSLKGTLYRNSDNSLTAATYYMRTDGNQYYLLAAPSTTTINASDIKRGNTETGLTLNYDLGLLKYDGARRSRGVAGSDNWIDANTLERGLGYWIAADPIDGETYSLLRMPMTIAESDQTVAVIAHAENPSAAAVHKGWNFIANPFMTSVQTGALTFEGGTTATNFVVTPDEENYTQSFYDTHLLVADYQLKPFKGYFVQVGTSGNLSFGASTRQAPARMAAQDTINEVLYTVTIAGGESKSGTMGFFIAPNYTDQYDIGFDFEWMPSAGQDAYALYNNTRLRYTALPAYLAKLAIPVAYTAREAGTYTWTLNAYTNGQDLEHVYLIDYELDVTHDLLTGPYEFTTAVQTENQTRFAIATEVGEHRAPTDVETVEEDSGGGGPVKFIYHDKMYILNDNVIYDATGKRVKVVANGQKGGAL